jgi:hypothetical protein
MLIEFSRLGKTYQYAALIAAPPPATLTIPFRPCVLKPPIELELDWLGTDEIRGVEIYRPVAGTRA